MKRLGGVALLCAALGGCGNSNEAGVPDAGSPEGGNGGSSGSPSDGGGSTNAGNGGSGTRDDASAAGSEGADAAPPSVDAGPRDPGGPLPVAEDDSGASVCGQVGQVPWSVPIRQALTLACEGGDAREWYDTQKEIAQVRIEGGEIAMHIAVTFRGEFDADSLGAIVQVAEAAGGEILELGCSPDPTADLTTEQRHSAFACESSIGSVLLILDVTFDGLPEFLTAMDVTLPSTSFAYLQATES